MRNRRRELAEFLVMPIGILGWVLLAIAVAWAIFPTFGRIWNSIMAAFNNSAAGPPLALIALAALCFIAQKLMAGYLFRERQARLAKDRETGNG